MGEGWGAKETGGIGEKGIIDEEWVSMQMRKNAGEEISKGEGVGVIGYRREGER